MNTIILPVLAGLFQFGCLFYCSYYWIPHRMSLGDIDLSWVCWLYCNSLGEESNLLSWQILAYTGIILSILSGVLFRAGRNFTAILSALGGGAVLLPIGLLTWVPAYIFLKEK